MLTKRIIPCLDVKDGVVVKGVRFRQHEIIGDIVEYAQFYRDQGADELVFYDITASSDNRSVDCGWVAKVARVLDIPFCVAGGIRNGETARIILSEGADKISINSPALENPQLITDLAEQFGSQCVVVGIDSFQEGDDYVIYQYTGDPSKTKATQRRTFEWAQEVQQRGAGEIVVNCMNQDGVRQGYDLPQLTKIRQLVQIPIIASGGAGAKEHFYDVFTQGKVDGALAASVFHKKLLLIPELKQYLQVRGIEMRLNAF
ncbi:imidazole glycerol phosphate synthase subunit HisF [soil metagenome]